MNVTLLCLPYMFKRKKQIVNVHAEFSIKNIRSVSEASSGFAKPLSQVNKNHTEHQIEHQLPINISTHSISLHLSPAPAAQESYRYDSQPIRIGGAHCVDNQITRDAAATLCTRRWLPRCDDVEAVQIE